MAGMDALELLPAATGALVRTVDGLPDAAYAEPSLLPGWTRGHVVAHLTLNAEGLAGALDGLASGAGTPVYASDEARDADIEELAKADPTELRGRLLAATTRFTDVCLRIPPETWEGTVHRTPGGPTFPAVQVPTKRLTEVEVHHVDLDAGYDRTMWSPEFAASLVGAMSRSLEPHGPLTLRASDLGMSWPVGPDGGPWISGTAADLAWWLTGRGHGEGLTAETGSLPDIGTW